MKRSIWKNLCRITLAVQIILPAGLWKKIPAQIPTHYGFGGQADAWGSRNIIWVVVVVAVLLHLLLIGIARYLPIEWWNLPVALTEENRAVLHEIGVTMLEQVCIALDLTFLYMTWTIAKGVDMHPLFAPVAVTAAIVPLIVGIVRMKKQG